MQAQKPYSDYLINPGFHGINRLFVLLLENKHHRTSHKKHFLPKLEMKNCNVMIDRRNLINLLEIT